MAKKGVSKKVARANKPPFWIPAIGYYVLSVSVTGIVFFILLGIWGHDDAPLMISGIIASAMLGGAVILREVVLKERRRAVVQAQKRIDDNLTGLIKHAPKTTGSWLTTEENKRLVNELKSKSLAAESFENLTEAHRKVFELCETYLQRNSSEINRINIASSKLQALRADRQFVEKLHKHHLLKWAVTDSASLLNKAKSVKSYARRIEYADESLNLIETALKYYPNEVKLQESSAFIQDFIKDEKVKKMIAKAEKEFLSLHHEKAAENYRKILRYLEKEEGGNAEWANLAAEIKLRLEGIEDNSK